MKRICAVSALVSALAVLVASPAEARAHRRQASPRRAAAAAPAARPRTASPYLGSIAVEYPARRVLFSDSPDVRCYPASCTKLMTARLLMKEVSAGRMSWGDRVTQTELSAAEEPSKIDLAPGESVSVKEALAVLMVKSANDVAVAIAEKVSGSVEAFVARMNAEAAALGMTNTVFVTPNGFPPPAGSRRGFDESTPRDLASLACAILDEQPELLDFTSLKSVTVKGRGGKELTFGTHNNLLLRKSDSYMPEADGLKTGYFRLAGCSLVATASRNGRRAVAVVVGSPSARERDAAAKDLLSKSLDAIDW